MRNIRLLIEYEGTNYSGWQVQKRQTKDYRGKRKTIQETLEQALSQILQEKVRVVGSGRTDAGVHALGQVANFKTKSQLSCKNIQKGLNAILPEDIRIKQAADVQSDFHARFCAQGKHYRYTIVNDSFVSPFLRSFSQKISYPLNIKRMRQAGRYFVGKHNFCSFQAVDKRVRDSVRTIKRVDIRRRKDIIYLDIEADGFLYRMVRNIVGTLIEVGRARLSPEDVKKILRAKNRIYAGPCAAAKGLCLMGVKYKN